MTHTPRVQAGAYVLVRGVASFDLERAFDEADEILVLNERQQRSFDETLGVAQLRVQLFCQSKRKK